MSRSSELEVSVLVAFLDLLALLQRLPLLVDQHAGRDLRHAHGDEASAGAVLQGPHPLSTPVGFPPLPALEP